MSFRYRLHARGLAIAAGAAALLAVAGLAGLDAAWRTAVLILLAVTGGLSLTAWRSGLQRARELGGVVLDAREIRRVRGSGRVVARLAWAEVRRIVVDRRQRMVLLESPRLDPIWVIGPSVLGGVGVERFEELLREIAMHTPVPFTEPARPQKRGVGDDEVTGERTAERATAGFTASPERTALV